MSFQAGERAGDYEVLQVLGAGGMGKVYKVRNVISDRMEAMKVLLPNLESDPDLANRFMREIKVQASLQHPNIAALHTAQRVGNQLVMLMEFVEGRTLEQVLKAGPIPLEKGIDYIKQVLDALGYAHQRGVIHRDIKPANMMLTAGDRVKLMDFGIAKATEDRQLTQTGKTVGSLYYMSPEQINGERNLDGRADLYSLGIALYEITTGRRPFQGDSDYSIMAAHLQSRPVPPIELDPKLPAMLNDIILMAIAKNPAQRFQSAEAFRRALDNVAPAGAPAPRPGAVPAVQPLPPAAAPRPGSARTLYMAVGSVVTLVVLAVAVIQGPKWFRSSASSQTQQSLGYQLPAVEQATEASPTGPTGTAPPAAQNAQPSVQSPDPAAQNVQPAAQNPRMPAQSPRMPQAAGQQSQSPDAQQRPEQQPVRQEARPAAQAARPNAPAEPPASQPVLVAPQAQPLISGQAAQALRNPQADNNAELGTIREAIMLLGTRANAMIASVSRLEQQQARAGLGIRPDVATGKQRMEFHLNEAEAAMRAGDAVRARRSLGLAEKETEKLEAFFGR